MLKKLKLKFGNLEKDLEQYKQELEKLKQEMQEINMQNIII